MKHNKEQEHTPPPNSKLQKKIEHKRDVIS